jgi:hypothetical protein
MFLESVDQRGIEPERKKLLLTELKKPAEQYEVVIIRFPFIPKLYPP